jgi:hypothetical protein
VGVPQLVQGGLDAGCGTIAGPELLGGLTLRSEDVLLLLPDSLTIPCRLFVTPWSWSSSLAAASACLA